MSNGGTFVVSMIYNIVMARILLPEDFGVVGLGLIFTQFISVLFSLGFGAAIIQEKNTSDEMLSTVFWINLVIGFCAAIVVFYSSFYINQYFESDHLESVLKVMSVGFIMGSISSVPVSVLSKKLEFKKLGLVVLLSMFVAYSFAIIFAVLGFSYWSIVLGNLIQTLFSTLLYFYFSKWRPFFVFGIIYVKSILRFGLFKALYKFFSFFLDNVDFFIVGKFFGEDALGVYTMAYNLARVPVQKIKIVLGFVVFPTFSLLQDQTDRFVTGFYGVLRLSIQILAPITLLLFLGADLIVTHWFGEKWQESIPVLKIFSIFIIVKGVNTLIKEMFMALGRSDVVFFLFFFESAAVTLVTFYGIKYGLSGVAFGASIVFFVSLFVKLKILKSRLPLSFIQVIRNVKLPIIFLISICILIYTLKIIFQIYSVEYKFSFMHLLFLFLFQLVLQWCVLNPSDKNVVIRYLNRLYSVVFRKLKLPSFLTFKKPPLF